MIEQMIASPVNHAGLDNREFQAGIANNFFRGVF
jgi:hypothetical protein